jgi:hypothetical protein
MSTRRFSSSGKTTWWGRSIGRLVGDENTQKKKQNFSAIIVKKK